MHFKSLYIFIISGFLVSCSPSRSLEKQSSKDRWLTTWATAPQLVEPNNLPPEPGLSGNTLRQIVRVSVGGEKVRLRFSNRYSTDSLAVKSVSIAVPSDSCNVNASTIKSLTFDKKNDFKIAPGADIYSDELNFDLKSNSLLAITISYA